MPRSSTSLPAFIAPQIPVLMARVVFALTIRPLPSWGWLLLSGIAGILMGFVLWSMLPGVADWLVGVLLGTHFIVEGAALAAFALALHRSP